MSYDLSNFSFSLLLHSTFFQIVQGFFSSRINPSIVEQFGFFGHFFSTNNNFHYHDHRDDFTRHYLKKFDRMETRRSTIYNFFNCYSSFASDCFSRSEIRKHNHVPKIDWSCSSWISCLSSSNTDYVYYYRVCRFRRMNGRKYPCTLGINLTRYR